MFLFVKFASQKSMGIKNYNPEITACFTGHRTYDGSRNAELERAICHLYSMGYRNRPLRLEQEVAKVKY